MTIHENLIKKRIEARVNKDAKLTDVIGLVIGEIQRKPEGYTIVSGERIYDNPTCEGVIRKMLKNAEEMAVYSGIPDYVAIDFYKSILPAQLSVEQLKEIFKEVSPADMKTFMSHLKTKYGPSAFNGKMASEVFKEMAS